MNDYNFTNIFGCFQCEEYVPPCERNPYYDDPRDVKPTEEEWAANIAKAMSDYSNQRINFVPPPQYPFHQYPPCGCDSSEPQQAAVNLLHCPKCGTYFQPLHNFDSPYCFDCRDS